MKVLICDDDASTRFAVSRLLTRRLECAVVACSNGPEAITRLHAEAVDVLLLDIEMPEMSGVEVLTAIRQSPALQQLPVVMMSRERREEVVLSLVHLGVDGYILKPPRADKLLAVLEPIRDRIAGRPPVPRAAATLSAAAPAMIVDGDPEYRRGFAEHAQGLGPLLEAESGWAALALYKRAPAAIVFLGEQLGLLNRQRLVAKLRALAASRPLRIVALSQAAPEAGTPPDGCDEAMRRLGDPAALRASVRRFAALPAPSGASRVLLGDVEDSLADSGRQICSMMLDMTIQVTTREVAIDEEPGVTATVTLTGAIPLALSTAVPVSSVTLIAGRMFGKAPDHTTEAEWDTAVCELCQLFAQRLRDWLEAQALACDCESPVARRGPIDWSRGAPGAGAVRVAFEVPGRGIRLLLALDVAGSGAVAGGYS